MKKIIPWKTRTHSQKVDLAFAIFGITLITFLISGAVYMGTLLTPETIATMNKIAPYQKWLWRILFLAGGSVTIYALYDALYLVKPSRAETLQADLEEAYKATEPTNRTHLENTILSYAKFIQANHRYDMKTKSRRPIRYESMRSALAFVREVLHGKTIPHFVKVNADGNVMLVWVNPGLRDLTIMFEAHTTCKYYAGLDREDYLITFDGAPTGKQRGQIEHTIYRIKKKG